MKKRIISVLVLIAVVIGFLPGARAAGTLFFVGVNNDIPVLLSGDTAPFYANGVLYAPYTVFSAAPGGVNISYDNSQDIFALFTLANTVVYDLAEGTMTDKAGNRYNVEIIYRNGILYLPVEQAAKQFGLSVSLGISQSGCSLLRFKDGTEVYDDVTFLEKSELFISHMLDTYGDQPLGENVVSESEPAPPPEEEEEPVFNQTSVYLAFTDEAVSHGTLGHLDALGYLSGSEIRAVFFLTTAQIIRDRQLVRDIYNSGHTIGLTVSFYETDPVGALNEANAALDETIYCRSVLALLPTETDVFSYCVIDASNSVKTVNEVLESDASEVLMICNSDVAVMLEQLAAHEIPILQLFETTVLSGQTNTDAN